MVNLKIYTFIQLLVSLVMFFSVYSIAEEVVEPRFEVTDTNITQGSIGYVEIQIFDVVALSGFELSVFYDHSALSIYNKEFINDINSIQGIQKDINSTVLGEVRVAVASATNFTLTGSFIRIYFQTSQQTPVNKYPLLIAIGNVYNDSFEALSVSGKHGSIDVSLYTAPNETVNYQTYISYASLEFNDTFTVTIQSDQMYQLSASNFEFYYDQRYLEVVEVNLGNVLKQSNMISDINTSIKGFILVAFASPVGINQAYPLITVTFKVISDETVSTNIIFTAKQSYNQNLVALGSNQVTQTISITKKVVEEVYPIVKVTSYEGSYQSPFEVKVELESNSMLAAGDFTLYYDIQKLIVKDITVNFNGYLVYNHKPLEGKITFSLLSTISLTEALTLLTLNIESKVDTEVDTLITISGTGLVNANIEPINLSFIESEIKLSKYIEITFIDYDNSVIEVLLVKENTLPEVPEWVLREHTIFIGFDSELTIATIDKTYRARYALDLNQISFQSKVVTYNGTEQMIEVTNLPLGTTVEFVKSEMINAGSYFIEAYISLDGVLQGDKIAKLTIQPKTIEVVIHNQTMVEFDEVPLLTFEAEGIYDRDNIEINLYVESVEIGSHKIQTTLTHPNYEFIITEGILIVTPYDYILGDVTLDGVINEEDIRLIMQYMLGKVNFNQTKVTIVDINQDKKVDLLDIAWIQLFIDGIIPSLELIV